MRFDATTVKAVKRDKIDSSAEVHHLAEKASPNIAGRFDYVSSRRRVLLEVLATAENLTSRAAYHLVSRRWHT